MSPKKRLSLLLETLEDRLTPSLTYTLDGAGNLTVSGTTANNVAITSTGAGVTVMDGVVPHTFVVTGNLTATISFTAAPTPGTPQLSYAPGVDTSGAVSLSATSFFATAANPSRVYVTSTGVNINGLLTVNNNAVANYDAIEGVNPAGFSHNGGGGSDTVTVGYNLDNATTGAVTVRGNVYAQNANLFGLGAETSGPAVVVQGITSITTHLAPGITFANPNNLDIAPETVLQGTLSASLNGPFQLFSTSGTQQSNVILQFGAGQVGSFFAGGGAPGSQTTFGNITEVFAAGASTLGVGNGVDFNGVVGGNISLIMGNGGNNVVFSHLHFGGSITYHGGSGGDNVTWFTSASALNASLYFAFGAGNDTFTLQNSNFKRLYADGGFGSNTLNSSVPISSNIIFKNF
jgi:hypothetical protein